MNDCWAYTFLYLENEASFNPFEEPEQPPPAYNEIQKDTIINLSP